jgi:hypothetical protein
MAVRLAGLLPAGHGMGDWYETPQPIRWQCTGCGKADPHSPAVLEYLPEMDSDKEQTHQHPGWKTLGWLAWWQCSQCGTDVMTPVTAKQVARWGRELGGWHEAA